MIKTDRRNDDTLRNRLNGINTDDHEQCAAVARWLAGMHRARRDAIKRCIAQLEAKSDENEVLKKEVLLLRGELIVEDIVEESSWSILHQKCRILGDLSRWK